MQFPQQEQLLAVKLKSFHDQALARLPPTHSALVPWFSKHGLQTSLQGVSRSSQLQVLLLILERKQGSKSELFTEQRVVCGLLERSRQLFDLAFINQQFELAHPNGKESADVTNRLERQFSDILQRAPDSEAVLFVQSLHLFVSMRRAFPKQTAPMLSGAVFRRQAAQVQKCYQFVIKPLFERKSLAKHYGKLHGLTSWLVLLGERAELAYDLAKKINSFLIYDKSENSIQMISVCNLLFDLLATRFPRDSPLRHHNLAALLARLESSSRPASFFEIWINARSDFLQTIDFPHLLRTVGSLGAGRMVVQLLIKLWNVMLGLRRYGILLHVFSGYIRKEFTRLSLQNTEELQQYLKVIKHFMIGLSNRQRFQGEQVDELTANLCRHALRRSIALSSCYRHILDIYATYQHRFSCLSDQSKRFFNQIQALAKTRMQAADVHAVYEQYAIRELGVEEQSGWESLRRRSTRYRGLQNLGNTCYINAVLQALFMTRKFRQLVHSLTQDGALPASAAKLYALQFVFEQLTRKQFESLQPHKPDYFRSELPQPFRSTCAQQDSAEFARVFLQQLAKQLQSLKMEGGQVERLQRLLVQRVEKVIRCQQCGSRKSQQESLFDLILPLQQGEPAILLSRLISNYFRPVAFTLQDRLDCGQCRRRTDAISELIPQRLSEVLVVTLSIFEYVGQGRKILLPLTFQFTLNLGALLGHPQLGEYELYAFIVHMGSLPSSGHYVCYARNLQENPMLWYHLNDGYVEELDIAKPEDFGFSQNQTPYMLFYSKKPPSASRIVKA